MSDTYVALLPVVAVALSMLAAVINKYVLNSKNSFVKWLVSFVIIQGPILVHAFTAYHFHNRTLIVAQSGIAAIVTTPLYISAIKPFLKKIDNYNDTKAKAAAWDAQVKSASELVVAPDTTPTI